MKRLLSLLFVLCLFLIACQKERVSSYVRWVVDGDTIVLKDGTKVRYASINAPEIPHGKEPGEPFGKEALQENIRLVKGKKVVLEIAEEPRDRFGRLLAYVFLPDGTFVQEVLVARGLAFACYMPPNVKYYPSLLEVQREAMGAGRGLWGGNFFQGEPYYLGNKRSRRFHRPSCPGGRDISRRNRVVFKDMKKAFYEGYCPCKKCRPWPAP